MLVHCDVKDIYRHHSLLQNGMMCGHTRTGGIAVMIYGPVNMQVIFAII